MNVDFELRVQGGDDAAVSALEAFLESQDLLDGMNRKAGKREVRFVSAHAVERSKASLAALVKGLQALPTGEAVMVLRTNVDDAGWTEERLRERRAPRRPSSRRRARRAASRCTARRWC